MDSRGSTLVRGSLARGRDEIIFADITLQTLAQWLRNGQNTTWQAIWTFAASIRKPTHLILEQVQPHHWEQEHGTSQET